MCDMWFPTVQKTTFNNEKKKRHITLSYTDSYRHKWYYEWINLKHLTAIATFINGEKKSKSSIIAEKKAKTSS